MSKRAMSDSQPEETFRLLVEAAPIGMVMVDDNGRIVLVNSEAENLFGYVKEELIGQSLEMLMPERYRGDHVVHRHGFAQETQPRRIAMGRDVFGLTKEGQEIPLEVGLNPVRTANGNFVLASIVNITERKRLDELSRARDKALHESQLKTAFVANISHELRTPVSSIIGMNELLLDSGLDDEQRVLAKSIADSAQSLLTIINDLLDISKIEAGKTSIKAIPFGLISLIQDLVRMLADSARSKRLAFTTQIDYSIPEYLVGDPDRIRQILVNLLANAIKFTDKGSIGIEAKLEAEDSAQVQIKFAVKDTGIGIADEDQCLLFQPFSQLDSTSQRKYAGTGLGLSICRNLVELMGGEIGVKSKLDEGSIFSFRIPLQKLSKHASGEMFLTHSFATDDIFSQVSFNDHRPILVVEDNQTLQKLAVKQLANLGLKVQAVSTGHQAIQAVSEIPFGLVFMDCNLPEMDGFEATKAIRKIDEQIGHYTYIVAMTASAMSGDAERCYAAGMDDYLMKPVTIPKLKECIQKWVELMTSSER